MRSNPLVSVLGSAVAVFSGQCMRHRGDAIVVSPAAFAEQRRGDSENHQPCLHQQQQQQPPPLPPPSLPRRQTDVYIPASQVQRVVAHPTAPGFLAWSLLFSCCLAHPSVMLRRNRVIEAGGYEPAAEPSEDYDLWLRMEASAPGCLANTGEVRCGQSVPGEPTMVGYSHPPALNEQCGVRAVAGARWQWVVLGRGGGGAYGRQSYYLDILFFALLPPLSLGMVSQFACLTQSACMISRRSLDRLVSRDPDWMTIPTTKGAGPARREPPSPPSQYPPRVRAHNFLS